MVRAQKVKEKKAEKEKVKVIIAAQSLNMLKAIQDGYSPTEKSKKNALTYMNKVFKSFGVSISEEGLTKNDEKKIKDGLKKMIDEKFGKKKDVISFLKNIVDSINISEMYNEVLNGDSLYTIQQLNNKGEIKYAVDYLKLAGILMVLGDKHEFATLGYNLSEHDGKDIEDILDINNALIEDKEHTAYGRAMMPPLQELPLKLKLQFFPDMLNSALANAKVEDFPKDILLKGEAYGFAKRQKWPIDENGYIDAKDLIGNIDHLRLFNFEFLLQYDADTLISALGINSELDIESKEVADALREADNIKDRDEYKEMTDDEKLKALSPAIDKLLEYIAKHSDKYVDKLKNLVDNGYKDKIPGHAFTAASAFAEAAEALRNTVKETILSVNKNLLMSGFSFGYNTRTGNFEFKVLGQIAYAQFGESIGEGAERYGLLGISGEIDYSWSSGVAGLRYTLWNDFTSKDLSFDKRMTHLFNLSVEQMLSRHVFVGGIANLSGGTFSWKGDAWAYVGYTGSWGSLRVGPYAGLTWMNLANIAGAQLGVSEELGNIISSGIYPFAYGVGGKTSAEIPLSKDLSLLIGGSAGALFYVRDKYFKGSATLGLRWDNKYLPVEFTVSGSTYW